MLKHPNNLITLLGLSYTRVKAETTSILLSIYFVVPSSVLGPGLELRNIC